MEYTNIDGLELFIFNQKGKLLVNLYTQEGIIEEGKDGEMWLKAKMTTLTDELLSLLYKKENDKLSDYEQLIVLIFPNY